MRYLRQHLHLLVVFLLFLATALLFWNFVVDDAYISYAYGRNLVAGNGLTYNGMDVEGYSNFLWVLLIALFQWLGADPLAAARVISILCVVLILIELDVLIRFFHPGIRKWQIAVVLSTVSLSSSFVAWSLAGLETIFFTFLVLQLIFVETMRSQVAVYLSPPIILMLALTRPEGIMFFPLLILYRLYRDRRINRDLVLSILLFTVPFGTFLLWRYLTYGYLLPNTAYVKVDTSLRTIGLALEWLLSFFILHPIYTLLLVISSILIIVQKDIVDSKWILVLMVVAAFLAFVLYAGRDWMPFHRFLAPLLPVFALIVARIFVRYRSGAMGVLFVALTVLAGLFELYMNGTVYQGQIRDFGRYTRGLIEAGNFIKEITSPGDVIAVEDGGAIAYSSERMTVDILGLNNEQIAHDRDLDVAAFVLGFNPVIIQLHVERLPSGELIASRDSLIPQKVFSDPEFSECYSLFEDWLADPYMPYLFLRECD